MTKDKKLTKKKREEMTGKIRDVLTGLCEVNKIIIVTPNGVGRAKGCEIIYDSEKNPVGFMLKITRYHAKGRYLNHVKNN